MAGKKRRSSQVGDETRTILQAREIIEGIAQRDVNEAQTCHQIKWVLTEVLGYDAYQHLTHEYAVRGVGQTDHVDLAITVDGGKPAMLVEIKRVGVRLDAKHIKQAANYAIQTGCEWVLLTNGRGWMLYHIEFGQPPQPKLVQDWNLLDDPPAELARSFKLISLASLKKGGLDDYWRKRKVLAPRHLLDAIFAQSALNAIRRELRKSTDVLLPVEDIMGGLRRLLNESALGALEGVEISFPEEQDRAEVSSDGSLKSLIDAGMLKAPLKLYSDYKGKRLTAELRRDGTIRFGGEDFDSPSSAASAARATVIGRRAATNGWSFWSYDEGGEGRKLDEARRGRDSGRTRPCVDPR